MPLSEALTGLYDTVLRHRRDELTLVEPPTGSIPITDGLEHPDTTSSIDWRDLV